MPTNGSEPNSTPKPPQRVFSEREEAELRERMRIRMELKEERRAEKRKQNQHAVPKPAANRGVKDIQKLAAKATDRLLTAEDMAAALQETQSQLFNTMNAIGLDAKSVAISFKEALDQAMFTGKTAYDPTDPNRKRLIAVPDLKAFRDLLALWGLWMKVGKTNGPETNKNTLNILAAGLSDPERRRVGSLVEVLEAEVKRRGLSDIRQGNPEPEDAPPLPGVVDVMPAEEEAAD